MRQSIKAGSTLEEAMAREQQIFSTMFLSMIRVAEARGGVPETLRMMGNHYEARQRLIRQARSAMIYPVIVLIIAGGRRRADHDLLAPHVRLAASRTSAAKAQLPWASRALLAFSGFVRLLGWWLFPLLMIGTPFLLIRFYKTSAGKAMMDRLILCDARVRPALPQAGHQPVRPHAFDLARRGRRCRQLDRADCRRGDHDADQPGDPQCTREGDPGKGAQRGPGRFPRSFPPTSSRCSPRARKPARSPRA